MGKFVYRNDEYRYREVPCERAVEVPVAWKILSGHHFDDILEVGNVLWHHFGKFFSRWYDVVDKYEIKPQVTTNIDIMNYEPERLYNLLICISTLEHIGHDEAPVDHDKCFYAYEKMKTLLAPGGLLFITWPLGYNVHIDNYLFDDMFDFDELYFMKRVSEDNEWEMCGIEDAKVAKYHDPYPAGNVTVFGYHYKQ